MTDCIELRGLRVVATCGVLPEEQARRQPFEIDLDLRADLGDAGRRDDLAATVDYGAVCDAIATLVAVERFALMEALAERIAQDLLTAHPLLAEVEVVVRKLRPPVAHDLATSGVRVRRSR